MSPGPEYDKDGTQKDPHNAAICFPVYKSEWDRFLNVYTINDLPVLPSDTDPGCENVPISTRIMRQLFLDAAGKFASEIWFDFNPGDEKSGSGFEGSRKVIDACYSPHGKGTVSVRIPQNFFFRDDNDLGFFRAILDNYSDDEGMFAIRETEFKDMKVLEEGNDPEEESGIPGMAEIATIRAFRISLKGHNVPEDLVVQICPRFWHMPTGFRLA